jgi:hypothetical protein
MYTEERLTVFDGLPIFHEDAQHLAANVRFNLVHEFHGFHDA